MKKHFKKTTLFTIVLCLIFALSACSSEQEFESVRTFELNFMKEEYDEKYNEVEKPIELEPDANYKIKITSVCESGTITINANYINADGEMKIVNMSAPCDDIISLTRGTTDLITFTVLIDSETEGNIKVDVLSDNT